MSKTNTTYSIVTTDGNDPIYTVATRKQARAEKNRLQRVLGIRHTQLRIEQVTTKFVR